MDRIRKFARRGTRLTIASLALSNFFAYGLGFLHATPAAAKSASAPVIYLNQAWSQEDREWYYQFSQGSTVMSYDIFLNLEVAGSQELFRSDANSERYGLITQARESAVQPGWIAGWPRQDGDSDAATEERESSANLSVRHCAALPRRTTELQRQAHPHQWRRR